MINEILEQQRDLITKHITEQIILLAAKWGVKRTDELADGEEPDCDGVPGVVKVIDRDGGMTLLAYSDPEKTKPYICDCKHDALTTVIDFMETLVMELTLAKLVGLDVRMPMAEHFTFEPTIPEITDVDDCSDAMAVIHKCMKKKD